DLGKGVDRIKAAVDDVAFISYQQNRGKGYAIRQGIKAATAGIIIFTDMDFPYSAESLLKIFNGLKQGGHDMVVGIKDEQYYNDMPAMRLWISKMLRAM